jgi:hypothetical protein
VQQTLNSDKAISDKAKSSGKWAQGQANDAASVQDTARKIYDQAVEVGADLVSQANKKVPAMVREYPIYAAVGGIFLGFLLGAALMGRRSTTVD